MQKMRFGAAIPTARDGLMYPPGFCTPESLVSITKAAEEFNFESVWGNDHITTQAYLKDIRPKPNYYEVLTSLSYLAAITKKIKLGTGVIPLPLRNPVILAKQASTLDNLSGGRLLLGVGIGAYREEFESICGSGHRGSILTEGLEALNILFNSDVATYQGKYVRFKDIEINPKPIQKPVPIYVGGNSAEHLERVARFAKGWLPAAMPASVIGSYINNLKDILVRYKRSIAEVDVAMEAALSIDNSEQTAKKKFLASPMYHHLVSLKNSTLKQFDVSSPDFIIGSNFVGTADRIIDLIDNYARQGVTTLWFDFIGGNLSDVLESIELFAKEVMPSF
ncbi:MAG: TIGR03619 family F420-dependent LLM class oxidoreductase [Conexivisphaerales archaeon]